MGSSVPVRVLLGVTGGIAAYKSAEIVRRLRERVGKLDSHFRQANDDIVQIVTSADKVLKRGDRIEAMEFETPPAAAEALPNPLARGAAAE